MFDNTDQIALRLRKMRDDIERETGEQLGLDAVVLLADVCRVLNLTSGQALFVIGAENQHSEEVLPYPRIHSPENWPPLARTHAHARVKYE